MKENMQKILAAFLTGFVMFFGAFSPVGSAPPGPPPETGKTEWGQILNLSPLMQPDVGYLEDIAFEKMEGKERVVLIVSKQPASLPYIEYQAAGVVLLRLENMLVPEGLRRPLGEGKLTNIIIVSPIQKTFEGKQCVYLTIVLKKLVPCSIRLEEQKVLIDFNVAGLTEAVTPTAEKPAYEVKGKEKVSVDLVKTPSLADKEAKPAKVETEEEREKPKYTGHKISLDFQDANIKSVFRLLSELSGISIVFSDDVKGNITVHMENVPWDQALDTILTIQGLGKRQEGKIVVVKTLERMKKEEADRKSLEEDQKKAEELAKEAEQKLLEEKGKLRQVAIEAKIIEATDDFVRNLGVQWGGALYGRAGSYPAAVAAGTNPDRSRVMTQSYPEGIGFQTPEGKTIQSVGVNFPTVLSSPTIGLVLGGASAVIEAQIAALEATNQGKIISSPKITTMDNVKATIKQGQDIPYITIDNEGRMNVSFKQALLELDVKPKITPDGSISMEIKATNDYADYARAKDLAGNPPINRSEVESKIVVRDGDTIVIGGILKTEDYKAISGVPWLSKIPVLGWLFKSEAITKTRKQLVIFITPKLIDTDTMEEKTDQTKGKTYLFP